MRSRGYATAFAAMEGMLGVGKGGLVIAANVSLIAAYRTLAVVAPFMPFAFKFEAARAFIIMFRVGIFKLILHVILTLILAAITYFCMTHYTVIAILGIAVLVVGVLGVSAYRTLTVLQRVRCMLADIPSAIAAVVVTVYVIKKL